MVHVASRVEKRARNAGKKSLFFKCLVENADFPGRGLGVTIIGDDLNSSFGAKRLIAPT